MVCVPLCSAYETKVQSARGTLSLTIYSAPEGHRITRRAVVSASDLMSTAEKKKFGMFLRIAFQVLLTGVAYYVTTEIAWALCFPNSKVSLLFPPHAVLVVILLLVPTRHWWAYVLATVVAHFMAAQQAHWPPLYALHCEAFDAAQNVLTAAGIRFFIKSPLEKITLRDAMVFVLIAVIIVPFGTAFWGAAFTISNGFGTRYWVEWRNLGISNGVTAVVLVPALLLAANFLLRRQDGVTSARMVEGGLLALGIIVIDKFVFHQLPVGPHTSPALLYAPIPLLIWAALRFRLSGISAAMLAVTFQAVWGAMHGRGPFLLQSPAENALALQMFLIVTGTPLMFLTVLLEDEKRSQQALHQVEERVTLAAEAAHLGVWEINTKTGELWMSDKARELFQLTGPLTYEDFQARVHPDDRAARGAAIKKAIATREGYEFEFRTLMPDRTVRWLSGRARCISDTDGDLSRLVGVSVDITKRKQAEELFRLATEASPSGTLLINAKGRIVLVNVQIEKLFGYKREELIGRPIEVLIPQRFAARYAALRVALLARSDQRALALDRMLIARRKDGGEFQIEVGLNSIRTPRGRLFLASVVDVSERKAAAEEARRQREQINLLSRVSLLGEMTASLAHDLGQPLAAIINYANAGTRLIDTGKDDRETLRDILVDVEADGHRAHDIIQNVRNTIKKGDPTRHQVSLNELVTKVMHFVRPDAMACSCEVETWLAGDLPLVDADPVQIQQVLVNLISNAIDAMRQTPVEHRKVEISTAGNGNGTVCLTVRDHGTGIGAQAHKHLFDQFFTTKDQGLGMGLAIVRSIVESHGGEIQAENVADGGARFHFSLPVTKKTG